MKKLYLVLLILLLVISCDDDKKEEDKDPIKSSMVNLPDSISKATSSRATADSEVDNIYEGIRGTIGELEKISVSIAEITSAIKENILDKNAASGTYSADVLGEDKLSLLVWKPDPEGKYDTLVEAYYEHSSVVGLRAYLTISGDTAKGIIILNASELPIEAGKTERDQHKIQVVFDGTGSTKTMQIYAVDMATAADGTGFTKAWVDATEDSSGNITVNGAYLMEKFSDDFLSGSAARTYSFVAAAKQDSNAVLKLALPLATVTDTSTMWSTYSIGQIVKEEIQVDIQTQLSKYYTDITDLESKTGVDVTATTFLDTTTIKSGLSLADIDALLAHYAAVNADDAGLSELIKITKLVNPAYYEPAGFYGTYNGTSGTLSKAPSWASGYDVDAITPLVPSAVLALTYDSVNNYIVAP